MSDRELKAKITGSVDPSLAAAFKVVTDGAQQMGKAVDGAADQVSAGAKDMGESVQQAAEQIVDSAQDVGKAVDQAGDKVVDSAQDMGKAIDQSSKKSTAAMRDMKKATDDLKIGAAALTTVFTLAARSNLSQQQSIAQLNRTYGDAADGLKDFADELQRTTTFSNDAAVATINTFGSLARNYGLTAEQIKQLTTVTADLATATGFSLPDAAERVAAAIRGEAESAEALGLSMNQAAIDSEGLTLTMSNQEAASFRLNALLEQTGFAQGAAAERAQTHAGQMQQLANRVQDAAQSFADWTGPLGESAAVLSDYALQAGVALAGVTKLASGMKEAGAASKIASAAMSPGGLVAAAGLAAFGVYKLVDALTTSYGEAAGQATQKSKELAESIASIAAGGDPQSVMFAAWQNQLAALGVQLDDLGTQISDKQDEIRALESQGFGASDAQKAENQVTIDAIQAQIDALEALRATFGDGIKAQELYGQANSALTAIINNAGPSQQGLLDITASYFQMLQTGLIGPKEFLDLLISLAGKTTDYDLALNALAGSTTKVAGAVEGATKPLAFLADLMEKVGDKTRLTGLEQTILSDATVILNEGTAAQVREFQALAASAEEAGGGTGLFGRQIRQIRQDIDETTAAVNALTGAWQDADTPWEDSAAGTKAVGQLDLIKARGTDNAKAVIDAALYQFQAQVIGLDQLLAIIKRQFDTVWDPILQGMKTGRDRILEGERQISLDSTGIGESHTKFVDKAIAAGEGYKQSVLEQNQAVREFADSLGYMDSVAEKLRPIDLTVKGGDRTTGVAADLEQSGQALETVFRVAVQGSNALAQSSQEVADWAEDLIGAPGTIAKIDQALADHIITVTQYKQAQDAQVQIDKANADVQAAVTEIQIRQAPILAKLTEEYAKHVQEVANMSAAEQLVTLGFEDATESMKLQQAVALAAAAANDELGAAGEATAQKIIEGAVAADPVLKEMLKSIGLITESDGEIKINFPEGRSVTDAVDTLTVAVASLITTLGGVPPEVVTDVVVNVTGEGQLGGLLSTLNDIDGRVVNAHVNTIYSEIDTSAGGGNLPSNRRLGGVQGFATGGIVQLAEAGPELVQQPNGANFLAATRGLYAVQNGSYVHTADATRSKMSSGPPNFTFNNYGPINGFAGVSEVARALAQAAREHFAGFGG